MFFEIPKNTDVFFELKGRKAKAERKKQKGR